MSKTKFLYSLVTVGLALIVVTISCILVYRGGYIKNPKTEVRIRYRSRDSIKMYRMDDGESASE